MTTLAALGVAVGTGDGMIVGSGMGVGVLFANPNTLQADRPFRMSIVMIKKK